MEVGNYCKDPENGGKEEVKMDNAILRKKAE
jgi:hypothetical protein